MPTQTIYFTDKLYNFAWQTSDEPQGDDEDKQSIGQRLGELAKIGMEAEK